MQNMRSIIFCLFLPAVGLSCSIPKSPGDIVLRNGEIYTLEESMPWASAIIITGNTIAAVLENGEEADAYIGDDTKVIDLGGRFVVPGFIDAHVHFGRAGAQINDANLMTVSDDDGLKAEMQRVTTILDDGEWISGGFWGAYEEWELGAAAAGEKKKVRWEPSRWVIDEITGNNPVFLSSFDRELYLANTAALKEAGLENARLRGMKRDNRGRPTGLISRNSPVLSELRAAQQRHPKSPARLLDENRAGLKHLAESGIVEIHDITDDNQMERYIQLQDRGELTCRVWMRPDLSRAAEFNEKGITMGTHPRTGQIDHFLRWGAYKGYIDGTVGGHTALFFEPYDDQPDNYGGYRRHTSDDPEVKIGNMAKMYNYLMTAHQGGFVANVHAVGTRGVALMLDTYERLMKDLNRDLEGYRVIHAQTIRDQDFHRFRQLSVMAEVNPYHVSDDMRWMYERIGERSKGAYAFKSLLDNGAALLFGSDWGGSTAGLYHVEPKYLIHAAVNRTTINHKPEGGWYPEQKISMHEALKAYTINGAYGTFEHDIKGSLKAGKLADVVVLDKNLMEIDPKDILNTNVDMTIVDGKIVYERQ